jgi:hypothetical protein
MKAASREVRLKSWTFNLFVYKFERLRLEKKHTVLTKEIDLFSQKESRSIQVVADSSNEMHFNDIPHNNSYNQLYFT